MVSLLTINFLLNSLLYILIGILGVISKESYVRIIKKDKKQKICKEKIFLGAALSFIIMPTLERYLQEIAPPELLLIVSYLIGVLSVELFNNISTLSKLTSAISELQDLRKNIIKIKTESDKLGQQRSDEA